jgi:hypothetical protein
MAEHIEVSNQVSERKACNTLGFARSSHRYKSTVGRQEFLRIRLHDLAAVRINYGHLTTPYAAQNIYPYIREHQADGAPLPDKLLDPAARL